MSETQRSWRPVGEAGLAALGMCLFGLFIHSGAPLVLLSACGLVVSAGALYHFLKEESSPATTLGVSLFSRRVAALLLVGCVLGVGLGIVYRWKYAAALLPHALRRFAPVAALIGSTEEVIYRGYIQGRMRRLGPVWAVVLAALCHTAYKCALFVLPPLEAEINMWLLATCTFLGGVAFGALRELAGSVLPPTGAHACFDIIAYGERAQAPWWVWC